MRVRIKDIRKWYSDYRKLYFHGYKMPASSRVRFKWVDLRDDWGTCSAHENPPVIEIDSSTKGIPDQVRVTLLHEMIHLANPNQVDHGEWFKREVLRLGRLGATIEFI